MAPSNTLPVHGNEKTMNLNTLVLTNIQASPYFKVTHLEAWERGSRKIAGQTGMCGGVRGVGTGGVVSSAYCLLFKLFTLKLTRKQVNGLLSHADSPFIRGLGFMYLRYTLPPQDLWDWFVDYFEDEEEVDPKAGGGAKSTIGAMAMSMLTKLDWYGTLFPRIPVPIQKLIASNMDEYLRSTGGMAFQQNSTDHLTNDNRNSPYENGRSSDGSRHSRHNTPVEHSHRLPRHSPDQLRKRSSDHSHGRRRERSPEHASRRRGHERSRSPHRHHRRHHHKSHKSHRRGSSERRH